MSNLDNLTSKIISDAEVKKSGIINSANEKAEAIVNKKVEEANKKASSILEKAEAESRIIKERTISKAELDVRNKKLAAKQEVIGNVFAAAKEKLKEMSSEEYKVFAEEIIMNLDLSGDVDLMMNEDDYKKLPKDFMDCINEKLKNKAKLNLKIKDSVDGGFIIAKDGIELNFTFSELVDSLRYDLEYEVGSILFSK